MLVEGIHKRYQIGMLQPAHDIIAALGGNAAVGKRCNVARATVWKWSQPKERGGTGGIIPGEHANTIIEAGREIGLDVPLSTFVPGATEALAAARQKRGRKPKPKAAMVALGLGGGA